MKKSLAFFALGLVVGLGLTTFSQGYSPTGSAALDFIDGVFEDMGMSRTQRHQILGDAKRAAKNSSPEETAVAAYTALGLVGGIIAGVNQLSMEQLPMSGSGPKFGEPGF